MLRIKQHLRQHFEIGRVGAYTDDVIEMITHELTGSVRAREMAALIGPYGVGKTHIMGRVKRRLGDSVSWVDVRDMTPKGTSLTNIINAIVFDLSNETLSANNEARARQAERLLGRHHAKGKPACIVIDDAHRLTEASLSGLKRLREAEFNGASPLCSIVMLGWERLNGMLHRRKDIAWRTNSYQLTEQDGYMTPPKRMAFLEALFQGAIAPDTRETIATLHRRPAGMIQYAAKAMERAYQAGYEVVDGRTVDPTPAQLKEALDVSYADIARTAKELGHDISKTTAHRRVNNPKTDSETDAVSAALSKIRERKQKVSA